MKRTEAFPEVRKVGNEVGSFSLSIKWWNVLCQLVAFPLCSQKIWWSKLWQIIALSLNGLAGFVATFSLYLCRIYEQNCLTSKKAAAYSLSVEISAYDISTFGIHVLLFFNSAKIGRLMNKLDETMELDRNVFSKIQRLSLFCLIWVVFSICTRTILACSIFYDQPISGCLLETPFAFNVFCISLYSASYIYTILTGYNFCICAVAIGYQFQIVAQSVRLPSVNLAEAQKRYVELVRVVQSMQSTFSTLVLLVIASSSLITCLRTYMLTVSPLYDAFRNETGGQQVHLTWKLELTRLLDVVENITRLACMCITADNLKRSAAEVGEAIACTQVYCKQTLAELTAFLFQTQLLQPTLTAAGFYAIGKPLLLTVISIVITYTIILSQFAAGLSSI